MNSLLPWPEAYLLASRWPKVEQLLRRCLALEAQDLLPHTLLLLSEEGLGREAFAIELAASLVCPSGSGPHCTCHSCERIRRCVHPDVEIVSIEENASEISIDQVKNLVATMHQVPYEGRRRVVVLTPAHTPPLNVHAASALLKFLEETPPHLTFVLLASNPGRLLPTIRSRAVMLRLPNPTAEELTSFLAARHGLDSKTATEKLRALHSSPSLLANPEAVSLATVLPELASRLRDALRGDALALVTGACLIGKLPQGPLLAARAILQSVPGETPPIQEAALEAAARLVALSRRMAALHLNEESVTAGALAPFTLAARRGAAGSAAGKPTR